MADFKINGKTVVTQSGVDEPVLASNVVITGNTTGLTFPTGHVLQTKHGNYQAPVVYSAGTHKIMEIFMTPRQTNSKFLIDIRLMHGMPTASNMDSHNFALQLGYKNTPASSTVGDYASVGGRSDTDQHMSMATGDGRYTLFSSDVVMGTDYGNYGSRYWMNQKAFLVEASPTIPSPPVAIYFSLWVSNDTSWVFSNSQYMETSGGNDYSGAVSSIQLSEIAG
jgi:hypothetical protein